MQKIAAQKLVKDVLQNSFQKERFIELVKNIFNHIEETNKRPYTGSYIFDDFRNSIHSLERIGKYKDPEGKLIDILIVYLQKDTSLERARTKQRNFVAKYLKSRGDVMKDAAIVAFVAPNGSDWRFSLVKMEYKFNEKGKVQEEFTPARRYSFLVGQTENSHTAQSRLLPTLLEDETNPTLQELENAFSVEKVTKEFFGRYHELFLRLMESLDDIVQKDKKIESDFGAKSVVTTDFAKKLLGQIVFLYFLQKKGWFGVQRGQDWGMGSKHFLRELYEKKHGDYDNFFNNVLEPLFYEALRNDRSHEDHYFSMFKCKIPFLNGGLFDPINDYDWKETDIILPNELFSNNRKTKEGDIGDGILDIFDRYNFTVKEDEPLEKEVAVDPEMLGKVFENLLDVKDRKSKGTYYTPREIVHYMCQESLLNYLATELEGKVSKEDIDTLIRYGETAVEHDSRVVNEGRETERYSFKLPESVRRNAKTIDEKLASIRVCDPAVGSGAFPVGMMNEIVRTRLALTPHIGKDGERTPYHFKRHAIQNCLYGVDIDPGAVEIAKLRLWLSLIVDEEERKNIQPLPNLDYKVVQGNSLLSVDRQDMFINYTLKQLEQIKKSFFSETSANKKKKYRKEIDELISKITNGRKDFDFEIYFSEVFHEKKGFDVVIANPPYVRKENLDSKTIKELERHFTEEVNGKSRNWSDDIYVHFIFQGTKITRDDGVVSYITNDSFIGLKSKLRVRSLLLKYKLLRLIRCPIETFEATIYTAVLVLQKSTAERSKFESGYFSYPDFAYHNLGAVPYEVVFTLPNERLIFAGPILEIYKRLVDLPKDKEYVRVLDTGIDSGNVRKKIFFKEKIKDNLHRLLQGKQMGRWGIFWDRPEARYKYCDIDYVPKPQKGIGRKGQLSRLNEYWQFRGDIENHHQPERLLMRQSDDDLMVAYQNKKETGVFYTDNTLFTILSKDKNVSLKYVMALLNSTLLNVLYHFLSQEEGKTLAQVKTGLVDELPLVLSNQQPLINLVDKILAITKDDDYSENPAKQTKVREYEKQIDHLVYKLYDLTQEEIKIVENGK